MPLGSATQCSQTQTLLNTIALDVIFHMVSADADPRIGESAGGQRP